LLTVISYPLKMWLRLIYLDDFINVKQFPFNSGKWRYNYNKSNFYLF